MVGRTSGLLALMPLLILLAPVSCCTVLGGTIGFIVDGARADQELLSADTGYHRLGAGQATVTLHDGTVIAGTAVGSGAISSEELRGLYRRAAGVDSSGARLPLPGDTILVSTATAYGWAILR